MPRTMLRFEISEGGGPAMPALDLADEVVVIGSGGSARIRLPALAARDEHVRVEAGRWLALHPLDGGVGAGDGGAIGDGTVLAFGGYRVKISPAPADAIAAPDSRTESLARELVRGLLGDAGAPTLEIETGPTPGARRMLAPPESVLVIGRGDEAGWVIFDADLSRAHLEVRRGWDGVRVRDRGSKNGTRVDGLAIGAREVPLVDGAVIAIGHLVLKFHDPAERHLRAEPSASTSLPLAQLFSSNRHTVIAPSAPPPRPTALDDYETTERVTPRPMPRRAPAPPAAARATPVVFYAGLAIAAAATAALVYLLAS